MAEIETGCLVLADITGYSEYLGGVELEHCHDVLANLLGTVAEQVRGVLRVAKFEGDAAFCYDPRDRLDGEVLIATLEACYFAFASLRRQIDVNRACPCDACRRVPQLDLKLIAHHGSFVEQRIGGSRELVGSDVVIAHRLLKSSVTERVGLRGYALLTEACLERIGFDARALGLVEHRESYDGVGEVVGWVRDLEARWREEQERAAVRVSPEESAATIEGEVAVAPPIAWEYLTSPEKKVLWRVADKRIEARGPRRTRGVGQVTHCMMKAPYGVYVETCLDWKPYRYLTCSTRGRFGEFMYTTELEPRPGGRTYITTRFKPLDRRQRFTLRFFGRVQRAFWQDATDRFVALLEEIASSDPARPEGESVAAGQSAAP